MKKIVEYMLFADRVTNYQIHKATGIGRNVLSKYATGKSDVGKMTLDNAEKIYSYFMELIEAWENEFGTAVFEGVTYYLQDQPEISGTRYRNEIIEEGYERFTAPAVDAEGNGVEVQWIQPLYYDNGDPVEDFIILNWNNVDDVRSV